MTVVLRGRGRRRQPGEPMTGGAYRARLLEAVAWDRLCHEAVRDSGPAPVRRRPEPEPMRVVVVVVSAGVMLSP